MVKVSTSIFQNFSMTFSGHVVVGKTPSKHIFMGGVGSKFQMVSMRNTKARSTPGAWGSMVIAVQSPQWSTTPYESWISQGEGFGCQGGYG